jgi:hypothetical protein
MVEFSLLIPVWLPLLLGTMWLGSAMIRGEQTTEMARDLASMYSRGVDFSSTGAGSSNTILTDITQQLGTVTAAGTGVVIFSEVEFVGKSVCASAGSTYGSAGPPPTYVASTCKNEGFFVFRQQYTQGNTSLRSSNFGTAPAGDLDSSNKFQVDAITTYISDTADRSTFNLLPAPQENIPNTDGYQSGQPVYVVEVYFAGAGQAGFTKGGDYAYAVF